MVVGAHALAYYGHPRYTGDLDLFVRPSRDNAERIALALADFSFSSLGLTADDFLAPGQIVQAAMLSRECLIRNKRATGRLKDLADVEALEGGGPAAHS